MLARLITVATLVSMLALGSACGSSSDQTATFKKGYQSTIGQLRQSSTAIGTAIQQAPSQTDAQLASTFRGLATRWQSQVGQLQTLKPPSKVPANFNTLTAAANRLGSDLDAVVAAAATHSKSAGEQAGASLVTDINEACSADMAIKQKLGIKQTA